jgi:hypothetical protein
VVFGIVDGTLFTGTGIVIAVMSKPQYGSNGADCQVSDCALHVVCPGCAVASPTNSG